MKPIYLIAMLYASLLFSCTSDIELLPLPDESSSSSFEPSSSSLEPSSSSTDVPSSSSIELSSSSLEPSSSSVVAPSSSSVDLCEGFIEGTEIQHYGKSKAQFCDSRDGKKYVYVGIGSQTWMAENLNYNATGSQCYNTSEANCTTYGRLYNWAMAMMACPSGWHLPTNAEWDKLIRYVDGNNGTSSPYSSSTAGKYLKATSRWDSDGGTDTYGFAALPGGGGYPGGSFEFVGNHGDWWSAAEIDADKAYTRFMYSDQDIFGWWSNDKSDLFSVRCIKDY